MNIIDRVKLIINFYNTKVKCKWEVCRDLSYSWIGIVETGGRMGLVKFYTCPTARIINFRETIVPENIFGRGASHTGCATSND